MEHDRDYTIDDARRAREQAERLAVVAGTLRDLRDADERSEDAAIELHNRARAKFERDLRYDSFAWPRDPDELVRMIDLAKKAAELRQPRGSRRTRPVPKTASIVSRGKKRFARWKGRGGEPLEAPVVQARDGSDRVRFVRQVGLSLEQQEQLQELEDEHRILCAELGYEDPFDCTKLDDMLEIARAVAQGHPPDPDKPPPNWPKDRPWLRRMVWDPDMRVGEVVRETLRHGALLLRARDTARLRLAWCIDLALDQDRSVLEHVLRVAGDDEPDCAGWTARFMQIGFVPEGCSPLRAHLASGWGGGERNLARDVMVTLPRGRGPADAIVDDLAESATAEELARLDAFLLPLAEELVETLRAVGTGPRPEDRSTDHAAEDSATGSRPEENADREERPQDGNLLLRKGDVWQMTFGGTVALVRDRVGVDYIARLIESKGEAIDVRSLEDPNRDRPDYQGDEVLDDAARTAYKNRLRELSHEREEAEACGDVETCSRVEEQRAELERHLRTATAVRGRPRILADGAEKVRSRVGRAIIGALRAIETAHPEAHRHLSEHLEHPRGSAPAYRPPEGTNWVVVREAAGT